MNITFNCLNCGKENYTTDIIIQDEYCECSKCSSLHELYINNDGEIIVEEF